MKVLRFFAPYSVSLSFELVGIRPDWKGRGGGSSGKKKGGEGISVVQRFMTEASWLWDSLLGSLLSGGWLPVAPLDASFGLLSHL